MQFFCLSYISFHGRLKNVRQCFIKYFLTKCKTLNVRQNNLLTKRKTAPFRVRLSSLCFNLNFNHYIFSESHRIFSCGCKTIKVFDIFYFALCADSDFVDSFYFCDIGEHILVLFIVDLENIFVPTITTIAAHSLLFWCWTIIICGRCPTHA